MFSDIIRTEAEMHAALFPRLLAMAERAWYKAPWELVKDKEKRQKRREMAWEKFNLAVKYNERPRLEKRNIRIMIPPPGARYVWHTSQKYTYSDAEIEVACHFIQTAEKKNTHDYLFIV